MLVKPTGIFLVLLHLTTLVYARRRVALPRGALIFLMTPVVAAIAIYLARNYLSHGSLDFRFPDWAFKDGGYEEATAVYDPRPSTLEYATRLGVRRVVELTVEQFSKFAHSLVSLQLLSRNGLIDSGRLIAVPGCLSLLALAALPLAHRRAPFLVTLALATIVGAALILCTIWHVEARYFAMFIPIFALLIAGGFRRVPVLGAALVLVLTVSSGITLASTARVLAAVGPHPCLGAVRWIQEQGMEGPILTFDPWSIAWLADRETVMIPSGGAEAIARVARRYATSLLLDHRMPGRPQSHAVVARLEGGASGLRTTTLWQDEACRVARLDW